MNSAPSSSDTPFTKCFTFDSTSSHSDGNASNANSNSSSVRCISFEKSPFDTPSMNLALIVVARYFASFRTSFGTDSLCSQPPSILLSSQVKYGPILLE